MFIKTRWYREILYYCLFGWFVRRFAIFASTMVNSDKIIAVSKSQEYLKNLDKVDQEKSEISVKNYFIETSDNLMLDTYKFTPKDSNKDSIHIISLCGSGDYVENRLDYLKNISIKNNSVVIGFNYRGIVNSTGIAKYADDIVNDAIAQVKELLGKGVEPSKIILDGHSLGGAVAALAAKHLHDNGIKINIFSDRSFDTFSENVGAIVKNPILKYLAKKLIKNSGWDMEAGEAFAKIPDENKEFVVIRIPNKTMLQRQSDSDDTVILRKNDIYSGLKRRLKNIKELKPIGKLPDSNEKKLSIMGKYKYLKVYVQSAPNLEGKPSYYSPHCYERNLLFLNKGTSQKNVDMIFSDFVKKLVRKGLG